MKNLKSFLLIISLIFFLNIIFFNFSYATLYFIQNQEGNIIMITNLDNVKDNYLKLGYTFYILKESESSQKPSQPQTIFKPEPEPEIKSKPQPIANIKIVDWTNYPSESGKYIYVEGILQNTSKIIANYVRLEIQALDKFGKLVSITTCYSDPTTLNPNQKANFKTMVTSNPKISKFNLIVLCD